MCSRKPYTSAEPVTLSTALSQLYHMGLTSFTPLLYCIFQSFGGGEDFPFMTVQKTPTSKINRIILGKGKEWKIFSQWVMFVQQKQNGPTSIIFLSLYFKPYCIHRFNSKPETDRIWTLSVNWHCLAHNE